MMYDARRKIRSGGVAFSATAMAAALGVSRHTVQRWETGLIMPRADRLEDYCNALKKKGLSEEEASKIFEFAYPNRIARRPYGIKAEGIAVSQIRRASSSHISPNNPKPMVVGPINLDTVYVLCGNHVGELEIGVRYDPKPLNVPRELQSLYQRLAQEKKHQAECENFDYFPNGPCVRLIRAIPKTRQLPSGRERQGYILELGPVSWEEFTVLNEHPDIRNKLSNHAELYRSGLDLRWCKLSNFLGLAVMPITSDGFGLVQQRSLNVSSNREDLTCGIAENIHRFLDEANPNDLTNRLHSLEEKDETKLWQPSKPEGIPSPLLAVQRGIFYELSPELHRRTKDNIGDFKFLDITFDLVSFIPLLIGIVELNISRTEVDGLIQQYRGREHSEYQKLLYLKLDLNDRKTFSYVSAQNRWVRSGLAAFLTASAYWQYGCATR